MLVGFMADIPFIVSSQYIRTFDAYGRGTGGRWAQHIGGKLITDNMWVIESLDESVSFWGKFGNIMSAKVSVTLKEYAGGLKVL